MVPSEKTFVRKRLRVEVAALEALRRSEFKNDKAGFAMAGHRARLEELRRQLTVMNAQFREEERARTEARAEAV